MRHASHSPSSAQCSFSARYLLFAQLFLPLGLTLLAQDPTLESFTTSDPAQGIWDYNTTYSTITIPEGSGNIVDLDFSMTLNHSWTGDLSIGLTSPDGTYATVWNNAGGSSNFGGTYLFDDEAAGGAPSASTIPSGTYQPYGSSLSIFDGESADGVWTLSVSDQAGADSGYLWTWSLFLLLEDPTDEEAIAQVTASGLPANAIAAYLVNALNGVALRDFGGRLFELRKRFGPNGLLSRDAGGNTSTLSRFVSLLNRAGVDPKTGLGMEDKSVQPWMGFVTIHPMAGYGLVPLGSAAGLSHLLAEKQPALEDPKAVITMERGRVFTSFNYAEIDQDALIRGVKSDSYATTVGAEFLLNDWLALGGGWSHLWNNATLPRLGSADLEGNSATAYANAFWRNAYADILYSYADVRADIVRNTGIGHPVRGAPDGDTHTVALNLGYNAKAPFSPSAVWGPFVAANYTRGELDGYTETGDPRAILTYDPQELDSLVTNLGWQLTWTEQVRRVLLTPQVRVGWARENFDLQRTVGAGLVTSPYGFGGEAFRALLQTHEPQSDWLALGAGLDVALPNGFSVLFDYEGNFGQDDAYRNYLQLRAKLSF